MRIEHCKPSITVFTDASVYACYRTAGWGGWAAGDKRKSIVRCGPLPFNSNIAVCELAALERMLGVMKNDGFIKVQDCSIILQSDSITALGFLLDGLPNSYAAKPKETGVKVKEANYCPANSTHLIESIGDITRHFKCVYLRHVRGHRGSTTNRHCLNELCDQKAKEQARLAHKRKRFPNGYPSEQR